jgi:preprotein translocase subunit YajC
MTALHTLTTLSLLIQDGAAAPATETAAPAPSPWGSSLIPLVIVGFLFFFMLILPERKKQKQRQKMLDALKKGDRVMTTSGMYGTVVTTTSEVVVLQVADNVRLRFSRAAVQSVVEQEKDGALEEKAEPSKA